MTRAEVFAKLGIKAIHKHSQTTVIEYMRGHAFPATPLELLAIDLLLDACTDKR